MHIKGIFMYIFSLHCYTRTSSSLTYIHTRSILSHMQRGNHITMSFDLLVWIVVLPKIFVTFEVSSYSLKIVFSLFSFCLRFFVRLIVSSLKKKIWSVDNFPKINDNFFRYKPALSGWALSIELFFYCELAKLTQCQRRD